MKTDSEDAATRCQKLRLQLDKAEAERREVDVKSFFRSLAIGEGKQRFLAFAASAECRGQTKVVITFDPLQYPPQKPGRIEDGGAMHPAYVWGERAEVYVSISPKVPLATALRTLHDIVGWLKKSGSGHFEAAEKMDAALGADLLKRFRDPAPTPPPDDVPF